MKRATPTLDVANKDTSGGKETDAASTRCVHQHVQGFYTTFLAVVAASKEDHLVATDIYLSDQKSDYINRKLVRMFISWYTDTTSQTTSHVSKALLFLQRKLDDCMAAASFISQKGGIREDPWIEQFTKSMLILVANSDERGAAERPTC